MLVCTLLSSLEKPREHLQERHPVNALFVFNCRMLSQVRRIAQNNTENSRKHASPCPRTVKYLTWKRLMSRGFPAFFRQFWLHLRKNLRKNLRMQRERAREKRETNESRKYNMSYFAKIINPSTNKTVAEDEAYALSHPHPSVLHDKGSFLSNNSSRILRKMLPCISISELLSQLAINLPGKTPPSHPNLSAAERDGGCTVATMHHSVAIPASLNLSVRDHINSTCYALLIGWDGKYGYPHQYLMRERGREG